MDDILSRIYQREEAAVKRERAMAYAFSHQVHPILVCTLLIDLILESIGNENCISMIYSGGPIAVRAKAWEVMNLAKLTGVGAGRNAGLLLDHGKAACSHLAQRNCRLSKLAKLART